MSMTDKTRLACIQSLQERDGLRSLHATTDTEETIAFSKRPCDCCDNPLYGSRETVHGLRIGADLVQDHFSYEVCTDCLMCIEYGTANP